MQLQLPGPRKKPNLQLGGAPAQQPEAKPKYSNYDVKILVLAIQDLHMNRFKNGWFTLYKFSEKVGENPKYHQELVEFTANNKIEQPDYLDPVIIFTARKNEGEVSQRSQRNKPQPKRVNLTIGIEDGDADGAPKMKEETKDVKEILAPTMEIAPQRKPQENQKVGGKPASLNISAPIETFVAKPKPKTTLQLGQTSQEPKKNAPQNDEILKPVQTVLVKKAPIQNRASRFATIMHTLFYRKFGAYFTLINRNSKFLAAEALMPQLKEAFDRLTDQMTSLDESSHQTDIVGQNIELLDSYRSQIDHIESLFKDYVHERQNSQRPGFKLRTKTQWSQNERDSKLKAVIKLFSIVDRRSFANREVVRRLRIWQTHCLQDLLGQIYKDIENQKRKEKRILLLRLNQMCKSKIQSAFFIWLRQIQGGAIRYKQNSKSVLSSTSQSKRFGAEFIKSREQYFSGFQITGDNSKDSQGSRLVTNFDGETSSMQNLRRTIASQKRLIDSEQSQGPQPQRTQQNKHSKLIDPSFANGRELYSLGSELSHGRPITVDLQASVLSEAKSNALMNLLRVIVLKGKQRTQLQEKLDILKMMQQRRSQRQKEIGTQKSKINPATGTQAIFTPDEEYQIQRSHYLIVRQVMTQWQIYAYDRGRFIVKRNIGAATIFEKLNSKLRLQIYDSLTRIKVAAISHLNTQKAFSDTKIESVVKNFILASAVLKRLITRRHQFCFKVYFKRWSFQVTKMVRREAIHMVTHTGEMPSTTRSTTSYQSNQDKPKTINSQNKASLTNKARQIAAKCIASIALRPRARTRIPETSDIEFAKIRKHFNRWKVASSKVISNRDDLIQHKLTALIRKLYFINLRTAFASWISFGSNDEAQGSEVLDQALITNQAFLTSALASKIEEKTLKIKKFERTKAILQVCLNKVLKHHLIAKRLSFEKWIENCEIRMSFQLAARHVQQLEIVLQEKAELERKIEFQTDQNEQLEAIISQADQSTDCQACRRRLQQLQDPDGRIDSEDVFDTSEFEGPHVRDIRQANSILREDSSKLEQLGDFQTQIKDFNPSDSGLEDDFAVALEDPKRLNRRQTNPSNLNPDFLLNEEESGIESTAKKFASKDRKSMPRKTRDILLRQSSVLSAAQDPDPLNNQSTTELESRNAQLRAEGEELKGQLEEQRARFALEQEAFLSQIRQLQDRRRHQIKTN